MEPSDDSRPESLTSEVVDLFRDLLHALLRSSVGAWVDLPLSLPQLRALFIVAHNRSSSVMTIAQALGIGEPTASHLIDRLVQAGLIERAEDPQDRRRARVQLSAEGQALIEKLLGWEGFLNRRLSQVSAEDLAMLRRGLAALLDEAPARNDPEKQVRP